MKKIMSGVLLALLLVSFESLSQEDKYKLESIELIRESLRNNSITSIDDNNARMMLSILKIDLERHGAEFIGLDPVRDSVALAELTALDIGQIEREAIAPILNDLCAEIESESSDPVELAAMYMSASDAQTNAINSAYKNILASLGEDEIKSVEHERQSITESASRLQFDWPALAATVPVFVTGVLQSTCVEFANSKNERAQPIRSAPSQRSSYDWGTN